jgi:hypothetical protein
LFTLFLSLSVSAFYSDILQNTHTHSLSLSLSLSFPLSSLKERIVQIRSIIHDLAPSLPLSLSPSLSLSFSGLRNSVLMPIREAVKEAIESHLQTPKVVRNSLDAMDNVRTSISSRLTRSIADGYVRDAMCVCMWRVGG